MPVGSSGRIGRVVIQHKRLARATGATRCRASEAVGGAPARRPRGTSRRVPRVRREERPRGVGAIECEQALGDLLEDVPVRLAEHVELREQLLLVERASAASPRARRQRAIDQRATRARSRRPSARNSSCGRSNSAIAASRRPSSWRAQPMLLASEPTQRRAPGSSERQASSIARSFHSRRRRRLDESEHVRGIDRERVLARRPGEIPGREEVARPRPSRPSGVRHRPRSSAGVRGRARRPRRGRASALVERGTPPRRSAAAARAPARPASAPPRGGLRPARSGRAHSSSEKRRSLPAGSSKSHRRSSSSSGTVAADPGPLAQASADAAA